MATQVQLRRGTEAEQDLFTGAQGELTYSTDSKGLRIHDGATMGGFMVDVVVAFQRPTAENNYTWYRKYADGWVEQGGVENNVTTTTVIVNLPVIMQDANYNVVLTGYRNNSNGLYAYIRNLPTATTIDFKATGERLDKVYWQVSGMAA